MIMYIDPGTGSMLFTVLLGLVGAVYTFFRVMLLKFKMKIQGGKVESEDSVKLVIFSDHKRYWNVFKPICEELERRKIYAVYYTASEDDPALVTDYTHIKCEFIGRTYRAYAKLNSLKAECVLTTTPNLDVYQWKRSKNVRYYVHITHGAYDVSMYRMFGLDYYDAVLLSGKYQVKQIRQLEHMRNLKPKQLEIVGIPYLDEMKSRYERDADFTDQKKNVLIAPTWGKSSLLNQFGDALLDALLETEYHIILRPHPQSYISEKKMIDHFMEKYPDSEKITWNRDNDNYEVLKKSDIMISDFSGVIMDYCLVFEKPIIYTEPIYDKAPYDCAWLEDEPWIFGVLPLLGRMLKRDQVNSISELIGNCINNVEFEEGREKVKRETWRCAGEGAKNTVDFLVKNCRLCDGDI